MLQTSAAHSAQWQYSIAISIQCVQIRNLRLIVIAISCQVVRSVSACSPFQSFGFFQIARNPSDSGLWSTHFNMVLDQTCNISSQMIQVHDRTPPYPVSTWYVFVQSAFSLSWHWHLQQLSQLWTNMTILNDSVWMSALTWRRIQQAASWGEVVPTFNIKHSDIRPCEEEAMWQSQLLTSVCSRFGLTRCSLSPRLSLGAAELDLPCSH